MRILLTFALLLTTTSATSTPPEFTLNLSKPAASRWRGALSLIAKQHPWASTWAPIFTEHNATLFNALSADDFVALGSALDTHFPEQAEELRGIAASFKDELGAEVSYEYLAAWVYYHELAHSDVAMRLPEGKKDHTKHYGRECTGVIAQTDSGDVLHIANMDQSPEAVRNVTLSVKFTRGTGGSPLVHAVDWYWFTTGLSRAVAPGLASMQENWRTTETRPLAAVLSDVARGVVPQIFVFRRSLLGPWPGQLESPPKSFEALVTEMMSVPLAAPYYVVMAGVHAGEGVVIARNLSGVDGVSRLPTASDVGGEWFLAQTNYDRWLPDPLSDPRRSTAEKMMRQFGPPLGATQVGLSMVASAWPVHNPHTAYTAFMQAAAGLLLPFVRDAMCPEHPEQLTHDSRYCQSTRHAAVGPTVL